MTGSIELDRDGRTLRIRFPYDELLVERVRGLPERRWDRADKSWKVPAKHVDLVVREFLGFEMTADVSSLLAGTTIEAPAPEKKASKKDAEPAAPVGDEPETVSQLNERVRTALLAAFPGRVKLRGEIIGLDKASGRRNLFFELVEKRGESVAARVDVAFFERRAKALLPMLKAAGLELQDGLEILVDARIDFYPAGGRFRLVIEDIDARFTLGKLALGREEILRMLREKGLAERNRSLALPDPALRIGVLTSLDSDGWNDFVRTLQSSGYAFDVTAGDVRVQGKQLRPTMLAGLEWFAEREDDFDLLCIVRGGGSRVDLAWFDDEEVALAVARHPLKVLCGIGHERDESVLDVIAHAEKTPTAVAHALVELAREAEDRIREHADDVAMHARALLESADRTLREFGDRFARGAHGQLDRAETRLHTLAREVQSGVRSRLARERERLTAHRARALLATAGSMRAERARLDQATHSVVRSSRSLLAGRRAAIEAGAGRLRALDPERVLRRGYALVRDSGGKVLPDAGSLAKGGKVHIHFRDGMADAEVLDTSLKAPTDNERQHGSAKED